MSDVATDRFGLGGVDQIGYVVASLDASMPFYESLFGPFQVYEAKLEGALFRGREIDCKLKIATNNQGPIEIELIEVMEGEKALTELQKMREELEAVYHNPYVQAQLREIEAALQDPHVQAQLREIEAALHDPLV